ncbi:hypothetical protein DFH06DRAFT_1121370 [Mycena polygramma]|nr:hypothetical protein DFH06DRAFT_1121370 [Mycena polygramma]
MKLSKCPVKSAETLRRATIEADTMECLREGIHQILTPIPVQFRAPKTSLGLTRGKSKLKRRDRFDSDSAVDSDSILGAESIKNRLKFDRSDSHSQSGIDVRIGAESAPESASEFNFDFPY